MEPSPASRPPVGPAVVARQVALCYGTRTVLTDASFEVPAGRVTALIGPNGSGKSTVLGAIAGLVDVRRGTLETLSDAPQRVRRRVALVLQANEVNHRIPVTVREAVAMGRFAHHGLLGRLGRADREVVDDALARLEIADLAHHHLHELSGGQRQRVFVAQGLVQEAELLLLDEPVTGLDVPSRERILDVIAAECDRGHTVVVSTHDLAEASAADHVVLLAGRVVAAGPPADALTSEALSAAYGTRLVHLADGAVLLDDDAHQHGHPHHHH